MSHPVWRQPKQPSSEKKNTMASKRPEDADGQRDTKRPTKFITEPDQIWSSHKRWI